MAVSLSELEKAVISLEAALSLDINDIVRDAAIQRFEFCIELSWKNARKVMGTATTAPKQVVREMAQNRIIDDTQVWLEAIDKRNLSSHTYNETLAVEVYEFARRFQPQLHALLTRLQALV
jgi:nucleotidyltransferase substrate binding protein (TIGR01987 family)